MVATEQQTALRAWSKAIARPAHEFDLQPLTVLSGQIPAGLRGSLYRNGPARLERGGVRVGHWFDGDGAVLGVHFREGGAAGVYRYVQSAGYQDETAADQFLYGNYGMMAPGPIWERWTQQIKNAANTSVLALPEKLLALWEGGKPHALDLETLETQGIDDLAGLTGSLTYSAHPKVDAQSGEIYNFGVATGANSTLNLYRSDRTGKILQKGEVQLRGVPLIHDFALAGRYFVFCIPPVRMNPFPALFGLSSFSDALRWQPKYGTQIVVVDRDTLEVVSWADTDPWYQWHFGHAFEASDGSVVLDLVRYEDFQTNWYLQEVASGITQTAAPSRLEQVRLDPQTGKVLSTTTLVDRTCEFPVVPLARSGQPDAPTYLSIHREGAEVGREMFGAIARFDPATGHLDVADCGDDRYPMEPIYAPDADDPNRGWVLTVVFDGATETSEVWIYEGDRLSAGPVARLALPSVVPMGFHGTWRSRP